MISETVQRFILTSIDSIPHLEAILLMRNDPTRKWNIQTVSQAIFTSEKNTEKLLNDLCAIKVIYHHENIFVYKPTSDGLKEVLDELADTYSKNLIEVTNLIHSKTGKQAQQFGDAFKWREE